MVPDWKAALRHAHSLLAPAGELHIVDFGQCEGLPRGFRNLLFRWLDVFHVTPRAELKNALMQLAKETGSEAHFQTPLIVAMAGLQRSGRWLHFRYRSFDTFGGCLSLFL